MNELVSLEKLTPAKIFEPGGIDAILEKIKTEVRHTPVDISTKSGRDHIASVAYKVARSKTALDKMGKDLGQEHYDSWKAITAERSRIQQELDDLRDEVRKPLTDWENAEKDRIAAHEEALATIEVLGKMVDPQPSAESVKLRIVALADLPMREWQEFGKRAADALKASLTSLQDALATAEKREAEAAELARLRAEEIARQQKERDDRIAAEAAERARVAAEQKAAREAQEAAAKADAERLAVEREKAAAVARAEKAESDRKAAAAKAEQAAKDAAEAAEKRQAAAIEAERKRVADEKARVDSETAKREADKAHRAKINREALAVIGKIVPDQNIAKLVIEAIARGNVPHVKIEY